MNPIILLIAGLSGMAAPLGNDHYPAREHAESQLRRGGAAGAVIAWAGSGSHDPEIRARCRRVMQDHETLLYVQHWVVLPVLLVWPCERPYAGFMDDMMDEWVNGYAAVYPVSFNAVLDAAGVAYGIDVRQWQWSDARGRVFRLRQAGAGVKPSECEP